LRGHRSASASDVYSLGGTLYYTLTGHPPYVEPKVAEILNKHLDGPLPKLSKYIPDAPESLDKLVQWAMAKDPSDRPSAADFATALHSEAIDWRTGDSGMLSGSSAGSSIFGSHTPGALLHAASGSVLVSEQPSPPAGKSHRAWILGVCGVGITLIVLALWMLFGPESKVIGPNGSNAPDITGRFPKAPATYGVLPPGAAAERGAANLPAPPFSWVGKHDFAGLQFVASKRGRCFYPITDQRVKLIRSEDFVGYKSAAQAKADGKILAD
jgi:hypothetical protein